MATVYKCFLCGEEKVIWRNDVDLNKEEGYEKQAILHTYSCENCGARYDVCEDVEDTADGIEN